MKKRGMSIHIGLNNLGKHYTNSTFKYLPSSQNDAKYMAEIASKNFIEPVPFSSSTNPLLKNKPNLLLLDENATTENLIKISDEIALGTNKLKSGDTLLITYSGHGSQIPSNEKPIESDGHDETWCLYDRQFIDEEIFELLTKFERGVRILVISDSCNNGTVIGKKELDILDSNKVVTFVRKFNLDNFQSKLLNVQGHSFAEFKEEIWQRNIPILKKIKIETSDKTLQNKKLSSVKTLPKDLAKEIYETDVNKTMYEEKQLDVRTRLSQEVENRKKRDVRDLVEASVIHISACQDWQLTTPGKDENSLSEFTDVLKLVFEKNKFTNYLEFHQKLWEHFDKKVKNPSDIQNPNYYKLGSPNPAFELETPFQV